MKRLRTILWIILVFFLERCRQFEPDSLYKFPNTPMGEVPQPERNRATQLGVELGKKLFFDTRLSKNGTVSCAGCHHTDKAFSDGISLTSVGVSGKPLLRHAPALFNLAWYDGFFWDGGSKNLEAQVFGPLTHADEMGMDLMVLVQKLQTETEYPELFEAVWGSDTITTQRLARAITQYERTLLSFDSRYDHWKAGKGKLNQQELRGYSVYLSFCSACHSEGLFTDLSYHSNGIDTLITDRSHELTYWGRYRITNDTADIGRYKTPSLRNIGFTAPYMHDGRFHDLDAVFGHYFRDHKNNPLADKVLGEGEYARVSEQQKNDLKAFLHTLNDSSFVRQVP